MALEILLAVEQGGFSNVILREALDKYTYLDLRDRAFLVKLVHGTLEYQLRLDVSLNTFSSVPVKKMKPYLRNLLRVSAYQLLFLEKVPPAAVIHEAVELVKHSSYRNLSGFVNAILRRIDREGEPSDLLSEYDRVSAPSWMVDLVAEAVGREKALDFFAYALKEHGISVRTVGSDETSLLHGVGKLRDLPAWKEGKIIVQDSSAARPVALAEIRPADIVLDVCASPGGKSMQAAEHCPLGKVIACDLTEKKVERIRENARRLHVRNLETLVADASVRQENLVESADVVLADLPCSGIGTVSKKPEIKMRLQKEDIASLAALQQKILCNVCDYVKPGGALVFSTCTLNHAENEENVSAFLKKHPQFTLEKQETLLPAAQEPRDGFFVCVMRKHV